MSRFKTSGSTRVLIRYFGLRSAPPVDGADGATAGAAEPSATTKATAKKAMVAGNHRMRTMSGIDALPVSGGPTIGVSAPSGNVKQPRPPAEKDVLCRIDKPGEPVRLLARSRFGDFPRQNRLVIHPRAPGRPRNHPPPRWLERRVGMNSARRSPLPRKSWRWQAPHAAGELIALRV
jgi:hypothetical protein